MLMSIQYARAIAALLVVVAHLSGFPLFSALQVREFGGFGVDLFFVISGFIMWASSAGQSPAVFAVRRLARVVPTYWFYTVLLVAICLFVPRLAPRTTLDPTHVLASLLFIPHANQRGEMNPLLLQGWTLNYEMLFYGVFFFGLMIRGRLRQFAFVSLVLTGLAIAGVLAQPEAGVLQTLLSTIVLEFVIGMTLGAASRIPIGQVEGTLLALLGGGLLLAAEALAPSPAWRFLCFGVPSALVLRGLLALEGRFRQRPRKGLQALGDASYSLYLVHPFVLSAVAAGLGRLPAMHPVAAACIFCAVSLAAACLAALASHRWIEKPLTRAATALLSRATAAGRMAVALQRSA